MTATPETIWDVPAYLPYLQPPLTTDLITSAQQQLGYKLPPEYLDLLRTQNGGYLRFRLPQMSHDRIAGIGPHFPSITRSRLLEAQEEVSFPLQGLIPFDGDGHWHLCLDYRNNAASPSITYIDIECDRQSPIADSFSQYLQRLQFKVGNSFVITPLADVQVLMAFLSSALPITFDPTDTFNHGYPVERARINADSDPEYIFISPNVVPRGFVRPKEHRYAQLKDLLPGTAPRYPQLPPDSFLLGATDGIRPHLLTVLTSSPFTPRPLHEFIQED